MAKTETAPFSELEIRKGREGLWQGGAAMGEVAIRGLTTVRGQRRVSDWEFEKLSPCCWVERAGGDGSESHAGTTSKATVCV